MWGLGRDLTFGNLITIQKALLIKYVFLVYKVCRPAADEIVKDFSGSSNFRYSLANEDRGLQMERFCTAMFDDNEYKCEDLRLVKRLGEGNQSVVFLAVDCGTKKLCAVKVMKKEEQNAHKLAATEREILSSLDHPFLPSLLNHFESEKHTFLAINYCSGGDINRLRHSHPNKTFPESTIR